MKCKTAGRMLKFVKPKFICIKSTCFITTVALRTDLYVLQNHIHISDTSVPIYTAQLALYFVFLHLLNC